MSEQPEKKSLAEFLKHPTANLILGFVLTGVIGGALTNYYQFQRQVETQKLAQIKARKEAITGFSGLNAEHLAHAERLIRALEAGAKPEAVSELADAYETAQVRWRTETSPALMADLRRVSLGFARKYHEQSALRRWTP